MERGFIRSKGGIKQIHTSHAFPSYLPHDDLWCYISYPMDKKVWRET